MQELLYRIRSKALLCITVCKLCQTSQNRVEKSEVVEIWNFWLFLSASCIVSTNAWRQREFGWSDRCFNMLCRLHEFWLVHCSILIFRLRWCRWFLLLLVWSFRSFRRVAGRPWRRHLKQRWIDWSRVWNNLCVLLITCSNTGSLKESNSNTAEKTGMWALYSHEADSKYYVIVLNQSGYPCFDNMQSLKDDRLDSIIVGKLFEVTPILCHYQMTVFERNENEQILLFRISVRFLSFFLYLSFFLSYFFF